MPSAMRPSSTSTIAVGTPLRAWAVAMPAPISPAPSTPTRLILRGLTFVIVDARVALQLLLHEEHADQVREIGVPITSSAYLLLDLQPFVERQVDAFLNRLECGQRGRVLAFRLAHQASLARWRRRRQLVIGQAERLLLFWRICFPFAGALRVLDQPASVVDQAFGRDRVEDQADLGRSASPRPVRPSKSSGSVMHADDAAANAACRPSRG